MKTLLKIWKSKDLRKKILFVVLILVVYRLISIIPVPSESSRQVVDAVLRAGSLGGAFDILELVSGGALSSFSIVAMGVGPYITASIIIQLVVKAVPTWNALSKEGDYGRQKINRYTRYAAVPIAVVQGFGVVNILKQFAVQNNVPFNPTTFEWFVMLLSLTAGSVLIMWLGELITAKGIGNGISLIIFVSIVSRLVPTILRSYEVGKSDPSFLFNMLLFGAVAVLLILAVVFVTEGQRNIPIAYARAIRGQRTYQNVETSLPLRVNMSGVVPIIFAIAVVSVPATIGNLFLNAKTEFVSNFASTLTRVFSSTGDVYWIVYFALVIGFTYFSTYIYFHPKEVAENLQKQGGYIPGIRPGSETSDFLKKVLNRLAVFGSLFLALIAVLPFIFQKFKFAGITDQSLTIGGTGLLIVISVVIETVRAVQAQLLLRSYEEPVV